MKILLLGSGGREHCLARKLVESPHCERLFVAPGNAGTSEIAVNIDLDILDFEAVKKVVLDHEIDFVIVGPEAPLVHGIVDFFRLDPALRDIPVLGPDEEAAALEGSKSFAKAFMKKHGIPTAGYLEVTADNLTEGLRYLTELRPPYVLKADGLAAGKGVLILEDLEEAKQELRSMIDGKFGEASKKVVVEEFLDGIEFSVFVLTDGRQYVLLPEAKDYKRIGNGDTGLNTGGMGSVSPVSFFEGAFREKVIDRIVKPTIHGFEKDKLHYTGFVFFGLIRVNGEPYVIEYNCRMGDPETQSVVPRIKDDLLDLCFDAAKGKLEPVSLDFLPQTACTIVTVAGGYPGSYRKGDVITGLEQVDCLVSHAGSTRSGASIVTDGGRVLAVTALDDLPDQAMQTAMEAAGKIHYDGIYYRTDIGQDLLKL